jgi:hypothetical protein
MERYHTDLNFQALIDRARAERAATLAAYASACGRLLVSSAGGMLARLVRLAGTAPAGRDGAPAEAAGRTT